MQYSYINKIRIITFSFRPKNIKYIPFLLRKRTHFVRKKNAFYIRRKVFFIEFERKLKCFSVSSFIVQRSCVKQEFLATTKNVLKATVQTSACYLRKLTHFNRYFDQDSELSWLTYMLKL